MSNAGSPSDILGRKVFFLYPSAVIQNEVVAELVQQEYEVYIVRDHDALQRALKRYPGSIVFADIDERMSEKDWEAWIRGILSDPETSRTGIGILSVNNDEILQRKYINSVKVQCGYTVLKSDLKNSINQILDILKTMEAKGRRKYIRAVTENETLTTINLPLNGTFVNGTVKDISVVGLSCTFADDPGLVKNTLFQNVQIKLQTMLLKVEGIVFGSRMDGMAKIYVILFTQRIDPEVRTKIRKYIQQNLQTKMDAELK
ncbi:MAG: pilus assembly protein PilZ [Treponema sp.]|nr:pilus assembly protein PilZ [Treponema sp.]